MAATRPRFPRPDAFGADRGQILSALEAANIEARPVWKPMHLQPALQGARSIGGAVSEDLFARGLCLPSGIRMTPADLDRVAAVVRACCRARGASGVAAPDVVGRCHALPLPA